MQSCVMSSDLLVRRQLRRRNEPSSATLVRMRTSCAAQALDDRAYDLSMADRQGRTGGSLRFVVTGIVASLAVRPLCRDGRLVTRRRQVAQRRDAQVTVRA